MPCLRRTYNQCEVLLATAIENESVTKDMCMQFLEVSDEMYRATNFRNILARAAARQHLAMFYATEGNRELTIKTFQDLLSELNAATEQYGHNPDWDEYIEGVSETLKDIQSLQS